MAITSLLTDSSSTNATSYTTASVDPADGALVLVGIECSVTAGTPPTPTVTGNGQTYTLVGRTSTAEIRDVFIFMAQAASFTAGGITIDWGASTCGGCCWNVTQFSGIDTADPIIDTNTTSADLGIVAGVNQAYPNTVVADSWGYVVVGCQAQQNGTAGTGWTLAGSTFQGAPSNALMAGYSDPIAQTIDMDWPASADTFFVAVEVKAAGGGPADLDRLRIGDSLVDAIAVGDSAVSKVYVGDTQVWP